MVVCIVVVLWRCGVSVRNVPSASRMASELEDMCALSTTCAQKNPHKNASEPKLVRCVMRSSTRLCNILCAVYVSCIWCDDNINAVYRAITMNDWKCDQRQALSRPGTFLPVSFFFAALCLAYVWRIGRLWTRRSCVALSHSLFPNISQWSTKRSR